MGDDDGIILTRWFRVRWLDIIALGVGLDPTNLVIGIYLGPIGIYLGDAQED